jgi:hypothetical protein
VGCSGRRREHRGGAVTLVPVLPLWEMAATGDFRPPFHLEAAGNHGGEPAFMPVAVIAQMMGLAIYHSTSLGCERRNHVGQSSSPLTHLQACLMNSACPPSQIAQRRWARRKARLCPPYQLRKTYAALLPSWRLASNRNQVRRSVSSMKVSSRPAVPESS